MESNLFGPQKKIHENALEFPFKPESGKIADDLSKMQALSFRQGDRLPGELLYFCADKPG